MSYYYLVALITVITIIISSVILLIVYLARFPPPTSRFCTRREFNPIFKPQQFFDKKISCFIKDLSRQVMFVFVTDTTLSKYFLYSSDLLKGIAFSGIEITGVPPRDQGYFYNEKNRLIIWPSNNRDINYCNVKNVLKMSYSFVDDILPIDYTFHICGTPGSPGVFLFDDDTLGITVNNLNTLNVELAFFNNVSDKNNISFSTTKFLAPSPAVFSSPVLNQYAQYFSQPFIGKFYFFNKNKTISTKMFPLKIGIQGIQNALFFSYLDTDYIYISYFEIANPEKLTLVGYNFSTGEILFTNNNGFVPYASLTGCQVQFGLFPYTKPRVSWGFNRISDPTKFELLNNGMFPLQIDIFPLISSFYPQNICYSSGQMFLNTVDSTINQQIFESNNPFTTQDGCTDIYYFTDVENNQFIGYLSNLKI